MRTQQTVALLLLLSASPMAIPSQGQSNSAPTSETYANTAEGLKQSLSDMRAAAKEGNGERLAALVKGTEIPNCDAWLHKMYDSDKADSWMGLCDAKVLASKEKSMHELFNRLAHEDGRILTRKVNDNPQPGKGLEWGWLQAIKQPLDIYWASWLPSGEPKESEADPIGYFMFIDGEFRWESGIQSFKPSQTRRANIVMPKLTKKVDPVYPAGASANHISGTVRVYFVIGADGVVHINPHATKEDGFSDDPDLVKAAADAVRQWRYQPLTIDGKPVDMDFHADIVFALKN